MVRILIRLEALFTLLICLYLYNTLKGGWVFFLVGILIPDLSMVGYLLGKEFGAILYNLFHNYVLSFALVALGFWINNPVFIYFGLIVTAHISMDRLFGFGLKYPSNFKDTHLQKL